MKCPKCGYERTKQDDEHTQKIECPSCIVNYAKGEVSLSKKTDANKQQENLKGYIGHFGLQDWWLSAFSEEERRYIQKKFQPHGTFGDLLTSDDMSCTIKSSVSTLYVLATWFSKKEERPIAYKLIKKAEELSNAKTQILDLHFFYGEKLKLYYKDRKKPGNLEIAINTCNQQIKLAPKAAIAFKVKYKESPLPGHKGYEQMAIILEKQKHFKKAVELCAQADEQGWAGNWQNRIERCKKKLKKI